MDRYSCNYAGKCEPDPNGPYESYVQCLEHCESRENKDLLYLIHEYDLESARMIAPSDQVVVLRRLTGVTVHPLDARDIIDAILTNDYETLVKVDELLPWIRARHNYSLLFEIPPGTLTELEINQFIGYTYAMITELAVRYGINLENLERGDVVRISDIPLNRGQLVGYNSAGGLLERTPYQGYLGGLAFAINTFPRVDYFKYTFPGNAVYLVKKRLPPFDQAVVHQVATRIWRAELGRYRIFTRDLVALEESWRNPERDVIGLYYINNDLYTQPIL
jgi:hypothetical protein